VKLSDSIGALCPTALFPPVVLTKAVHLRWTFGPRLEGEIQHRAHIGEKDTRATECTKVLLLGQLASLAGITVYG